MKKLFVGALVLCIAFTSCKKDCNLISEGSVKKGTKFTACIGIDQNRITIDGKEMPGGNLKIGATTPIGDDDLIAIVVNELDSKGNFHNQIAGGLFTGDIILASNSQADFFLPKQDISQESEVLKVELKHGFNYEYEATLVKNGKNVKKEGATNRYLEPFNAAGNMDLGTDIKADVNYWTGTNAQDFYNLTYTRRYEVGETPTVAKCAAEQDRWYCKITQVADYNNRGIELNLRRVSFKVNYKVENICEGYFVKANISETHNSSPTGTDFSELNAIRFMSPVGGKCEESKVYSSNNITDAYSFINKGNPVPVDRFTIQFGIYENEACTKLIKKFEKAFNPESNKQYEITFDANPYIEIAIDIIIDDVWNPTTENLN